MVRGLARADQEGAQLVVLQIDTPGGLDTSMRDIIKAILASPVPVATYVAPERRARGQRRHLHPVCQPHRGDGAGHQPGRGHAGADRRPPGAPPQPPEASAGSGAADRRPERAPMRRQDALTRKQVNDAAAYIRGLAQLRGRNAEWAEQAVREAVSLSAEEALARKVIDLIAADDLPALLASSTAAACAPPAASTPGTRAVRR